MDERFARIRSRRVAGVWVVGVRGTGFPYYCELACYCEFAYYYGFADYQGFP